MQETIYDTYRWCPRCGQSFNKKEKALQCSGCGYTYYLNPKSSATAILRNKQGKILFCKRAFDPKKGFWDLPGGFLDQHESFEDCVRREVREELGLTITGLSYLGSFPNWYRFQDEEVDVTDTFFIATVDSFEIMQPQDDVASTQFFAPNTIPWDKLAFQSHHPALQLLLENAL